MEKEVFYEANLAMENSYVKWCDLTCNTIS